jgi:hypothetical protein
VWRERLAAAWRRLDVYERAAVVVWAGLLLAVCARSAIKPEDPTLYRLWEDAGRAWSRGEDLYTSQPGHPLVGFRYGPLTAAGFTPLQLLDNRTGNVLWRLLNALPLLAAIAWWLRVAGPAFTRRQRGLFYLWLAPLLLPSLNTGQPNLILLACVMACLAAVAAGRWNLAAGVIALAAAIKVYPLAIGLLLAAAHPRRLAPRLAAAVALLIALPLLLQHPGYAVRQYARWLELLGQNDSYRRFLPFQVAETYRDALLLLRLFNVPISLKVYTCLQLLASATCAVLVVMARRRGVPTKAVLLHVLVLGSAWMMLWGPATEGRTYVMMAPALACWLLHLHRHGPGLARYLVAQAAGLLLLCAVCTVSPHGPRIYHAAGLHPLAGVLLVVSYLLAGYPGGAIAVPESVPDTRPARAA